MCYTESMEAKGRQQLYIDRARPVLARLEEAGFEAFLVGGCVRESLRETVSPGEAKATDLDVTTSALPEETVRLFSDWIVIETGIQHGTVTVRLPGSGDPVEITTYRWDGPYSDGRHPDEVRFVRSLTEDLARRDFTVNAMALDRRGNLIDLFGGQEDLARGLIRTVGEPEARFREDGLRILRALRFAAALDAQIWEETAAALRTCRGLLAEISAERIYAELKKLICGNAAGRILRQYTDVLSAVLPELAEMKGFDQHNPYHRYDVLEHCIRTVEAVEISPDNEAVMKLAALLHDAGKPQTFSLDEEGIGHFYGHPSAGAEIACRIMCRLKADRAAAERVVALIRCHDLIFEEDDRLLKRWMGRYTPEVLLQILALKRADNIATGNVTAELLEKFDRIEKRIRHILEEEDCITIAGLAIGGRDLLALGVAEGPLLGEILRDLLDGVIDGWLLNEREALLAEAGRLLEESAD
ncbi:MAG: HD domain-containing protein [Bacillota bacterium]|nr:HD domain-containing protein [Bacillota bacterium]